MSVQASSWAWEQDLEPVAKLVLLALANRTNHETGACFPGQKLLAKECGMSDRNVRRHLKDLERRGLIERRPRMRSEGRGRTSDEYRIVWDQPDNVSGKSRPTGQIEHNQPDTRVRGRTVREPEGCDGSAEFYVRRLVVDLEQNHHTAVDLTADSLGENYLAVARTASQVFDENTHRGQIIGLTVELLERAFGSMPKQARGMVARLVGTHRPMAVLEAAVRTTGASVGLDPKYAEDPLGPVRYLAGVLRGGR